MPPMEDPPIEEFHDAVEAPEDAIVGNSGCNELEEQDEEHAQWADASDFQDAESEDAPTLKEAEDVTEGSRSLQLDPGVKEPETGCESTSDASIGASSGASLNTSKATEQAADGTREPHPKQSDRSPGPADGEGGTAHAGQRSGSAEHAADALPQMHTSAVPIGMLAKADALKAEGNELYKERKLDKVWEKYWAAVDADALKAEGNELYKERKLDKVWEKYWAAVDAGEAGVCVLSLWYVVAMMQ
eukprot:gene19062-25666_t